MPASALGPGLEAQPHALVDSRARVVSINRVDTADVQACEYDLFPSLSATRWMRYWSLKAALFVNSTGVK